MEATAPRVGDWPGGEDRRGGSGQGGHPDRHETETADQDC